MNKKVLVTLGVVVLLVLGMTFPKGKTVVERIVEVGSVSGPTITSPFLDVNGVVTEYRSQRFTTGTTTVCALQSPTYATSTLRNGNVNFTVSSTSATTVTVAKATTAFATTTLLRTVSIAANARATFPIASTTSSASTAAFALEQTNLTFAPGTYIVVGMAGGIGTFSPTGGCNAEFSVAK